MTVKEYLRQIYRYDVLAKNAKEEVEEILQQIGGLKAVSYDGIKVTSSSTGSPVEDAFIHQENRLKKARLAYIRASNFYCDKRETIVKQIDGLDDPVYTQLLYLRYAKYKDWLTISKIMQYDYNYLSSDLHNKALTAFGKKYKI